MTDTDESEIEQEQLLVFYRDSHHGGYELEYAASIDDWIEQQFASDREIGTVGYLTTHDIWWYIGTADRVEEILANGDEPLQGLSYNVGEDTLYGVEHISPRRILDVLGVPYRKSPFGDYPVVEGQRGWEEAADG